MNHALMCDSFYIYSKNESVDLIYFWRVPQNESVDLIYFLRVPQNASLGFQFNFGLHAPDFGFLVELFRCTKQFHKKLVDIVPEEKTPLESGIQ